MRANKIITEMAMAKAEQNVTSLSPLIFENLIKLKCYDAIEWRQLWCIEINAWLRTIASIKLKSSGKHLDVKTLNQWLVHDSGSIYDGEYVTYMLNMLNADYKRLKIVDHDPDKVMEEILDIIHEVCTAISNKQFSGIQSYM